MKKYYMYIFIALAAIPLIYIAQRAGEFMAAMDIVTPSHTTAPAPSKDTEKEGENARVGEQISTPVPGGKLKADVFTGTLKKVDTGCFADGECYVEVDDKHVTALRGWSRDTVGNVQGVPSFGDLEKYIGKSVEVYAQVLPDGTYTLYGSEGFYIKPVEGTSGTLPTKPVASGGCVVGGCSKQLCLDEEHVARDGDATTCEWEESYACYQTATCERQVSGQCGWTETKELTQCLADAKTSVTESIQ